MNFAPRPRLRRAMPALAALAPLLAVAGSPSFDCRHARGSVQALICRDDALAALDRQLVHTFAEARRQAPDEIRPALRGEQRGWLKGRDACWKADDQRACVESSYRHRIAELQARYRLVPGIGPVTFICDGDPRNEVVATFFRTDPATMIAARGDGVSLMFVQPSGSGARYQGRNESFWEHQGEALVTWGYGAPEMRCRKSP